MFIFAWFDFRVSGLCIMTRNDIPSENKLLGWLPWDSTQSRLQIHRSVRSPLLGFSAHYPSVLRGFTDGGLLRMCWTRRCKHIRQGIICSERSVAQASTTMDNCLNLQMGAAETRRRTAGEPDVDLNQLVEVRKGLGRVESSEFHPTAS